MLSRVTLLLKEVNYCRNIVHEKHAKSRKQEKNIGLELTHRLKADGRPVMGVARKWVERCFSVSR